MSKLKTIIMIVGSICLSDIPKERIFVHTNGKKYIDIVIDDKYGGADQWGNTHEIYMGQSKEERMAKERKTYIGRGKEFVFEKKAVTAQEAQVPQDLPAGDDDLDF